MKRKIKYYSLYDKILHYHFRKLRLLRNQHVKQKTQDYSRISNTLAKQKMDIKNRIEDSLNGALIFAQIIRTGFISKGGRNYGIDFVSPNLKDDLTDNRKILSKYEDESEYKKILIEHKKNSEKYKDHAHYEVTGELKEIRAKLIEEHIDFVSEVFSEEKIHHLLNAIFAYHGTRKDYELIDDEKQYMINVAAMMTKKSLTELKKYLHPDRSKYFEEDLNRTIEICEMIRNSKDKELYDEPIRRIRKVI